MSAFLLVLSSPSGGGKTTIAQRLLATRRDVGYSVSATTRPRRPGEQHGQDYWFLERVEFLRRVEHGEFLEHASYAGHLYGTLRAEVDRIVGGGRKAVLDLEVQGARQVRERYRNAVLVFVVPPSAAELIARLRGRNTEADHALRTRLTEAAAELAAVQEYDYLVVNDDLDHAVAQVGAVLDAESLRVPRRDDMESVLEQMRRDVAAEAAAIPVV